MIAPAGPFALMNVGVTFAGLGIAMQMAQCNGFVGSLKEHVRLHFGMLHAFYGKSLQSHNMNLTHRTVHLRSRSFRLAAGSNTLCDCPALGISLRDSGQHLGHQHRRLGPCLSYAETRRYITACSLLAGSGCIDHHCRRIS